jgi:hypothetical protein
MLSFKIMVLANKSFTYHYTYYFMIDALLLFHFTMILNVKTFTF